MLKILFSVLLLSQIYAAEINIYNGGSINDAVIKASTGDVIIVHEGYYSETGIIINKTIELRGVNTPIIDAQGIEQIVTIAANNVTISGFLIKNSGNSSLKDMAGIKVENVSNCTIKNNILEFNYFGIYLANASNCSVISNRVSSNAVSETSSGNGIHLWKCDSILIRDNIISGHRDGIYFEFATNCFISGNFSTKNIRYGLHFMFSNNDIYERNTFTDNGAGVAVMYTKYVTMSENKFDDNWGPNSYGLLLKEISHSSIIKNTFSRNTVGIYAEGGSDLIIEKNEFNANGWAAKILGNCYDNKISLNNFTANSFDVVSNSSRSVNIFSNNYWDKYTGYDINKDGMGDVPYRPASLFSIMVEDSPGTILLLRSLIVDVMDMAEKVMPLFIPEALTDNTPLMNKYNDTDKRITEIIR
jgi:nitrous oxidase accessory protein